MVHKTEIDHFKINLPQLTHTHTSIASNEHGFCSLIYWTIIIYYWRLVVQSISNVEMLNKSGEKKPDPLKIEKWTFHWLAGNTYKYTLSMPQNYYNFGLTMENGG